MSVLAVDHLLERARCEQVALELEQLAGIDLVGAGRPRSVLCSRFEAIAAGTSMPSGLQGDGGVGEPDHLRPCSCRNSAR